MAIKFVDNWMRSHRKYSVQAMALAASIETSWTAFSGTTLAQALPPSTAKYIAYLVVGLLGCGIFGSMIDQGEVTAPPPQKDKQC